MAQCRRRLAPPAPGPRGLGCWRFSRAVHRRSSIEGLAAAYLDALHRLIEHCCGAAGGFTPSDFAAQGLEQADLDRWFERYGQEVEEIYELSPMQEGMLFESLYAPESGVYVTQLCFTLDRRVDAAALRQAAALGHLDATFALADKLHADGKTTLVLGPSGSGKSTLVKLLVGLYTPVEGDILYDDVSSKDIRYNRMRKQLGFVTQETNLFSGSIRDNLKFVKPDATDEEIYAALEKASALPIINNTEKGLDTLLGEGGKKLSGGEKQRLSIARALLRQPRLLIFDEATSALDSITEEEITNTIRNISSEKEQITVMIAHRLSTIMHADRIYVLEGGDVVETGSHHELLEEKGLYYAMWRQQIGERKKLVAATS
mgnify:CR=1 FL=1